MKTVGALSCVWNTLTCRARIVSPAIAADPVNFRVGLHPLFDCFRLAIRYYEGYPLGSLESSKGIERITAHNAR
jgi:hypothetical protein